MACLLWHLALCYFEFFPSLCEEWSHHWGDLLRKWQSTDRPFITRRVFFCSADGTLQEAAESGRPPHSRLFILLCTSKAKPQFQDWVKCLLVPWTHQKEMGVHDAPRASGEHASLGYLAISSICEYFPSSINFRTQLGKLKWFPFFPPCPAYIFSPKL